MGQNPLLRSGRCSGCPSLSLAAHHPPLKGTVAQDCLLKVSRGTALPLNGPLSHLFNEETRLARAQLGGRHAGASTGLFNEEVRLDSIQLGGSHAGLKPASSMKRMDCVQLGGSHARAETGLFNEKERLDCVQLGGSHAGA